MSYDLLNQLNQILMITKMLASHDVILKTGQIVILFYLSVQTQHKKFLFDNSLPELKITLHRLVKYNLSTTPVKLVK